MHELSIALSILEIAEEEASRRNAARIQAIHLRLGPLAGVIKEALLSAFDLARETSALNDCTLVIEDVPLIAHCPACGKDCRVAAPQEMCCSVCGTPTPQIVQGRELEISAMEICP